MKGQGSALLSRFPLREGAHGGTTGENARAIDGGKLIRASFWPSGWRQWPEWPKGFSFYCGRTGTRRRAVCQQEA